MSRHRAIAPLLVIGLGSAALAGCVSKSTFLQKVDEWVRVRSQLESCDKEMGRAAEFRATLETDLKASERRTALCQLEKKAVSVTVDDKAKLETELKAEIEGLRGKYKTIADDMNELRAKHGTADETIRGLQKRLRELRVEARREPDLSDVRKALRTEVDESNGLLSVSLPKGAVVLRIPHSQLFAKRNALLSREGKELIARLADSLRRLKDRSFLVQGHQDASAPPRKLGTPLDLSHYQAAAVSRELMRSGLEPQKVTCAGLGASRPAAAPDAQDAEEQNRRIELVITPTPATETLEVITPDSSHEPSRSAP